MPYFPCAICSAVLADDDVRCELCSSEFCSGLADCDILHDAIEFDVANDATISARQHSSSAAPMQLYFIIMVFRMVRLYYSRLLSQE